MTPMAVPLNSTDRREWSEWTADCIGIEIRRLANQRQSDMLEDLFVSRASDRSGTSLHEVPVAFDISNKVSGDQS